MAIRPNAIRRILADDRVALGFGVSLLTDGSAARLARAAGYDWLALDAEHGSLSLPQIAAICAAALDVGVTPIVRVNPAALDEASRALDCGAQGVIVPSVG